MARDAIRENRLLGKEGQGQHQIPAREQIQPAPRIRRGPLAATEQHDRWVEDQNAREAQPRLPGRGGRRQLRRNHIPAQHVDNPNSVKIKKA